MLGKSFVGLFLFMLTAQTVHAEEVIPWMFRDNNPRQATVTELTDVRSTPEGLLIRTTTDGYIAWTGKPVPGPTDVITLTIRSSSSVQAYLMWNPTDGTEGLYQIPFEIPPSEFGQQIHIIVSDYNFWDENTTGIALRFPAGTNVIIEEIEFRHWGWDEKIVNAFRSFWTFDRFKAYSINFLWGPLLATNSPGVDALYEGAPPTAWSATRFFYVIFILAIIASLLTFRRNRSLALGVFATVFVFLWSIFDIRMSLEILSYAKNDWTHYVTAPEEQKQLRSHGNYYAIQNTMLSTIREQESFVLLKTPIDIVFPNLRYAAYPTRLIPEGNDATGNKLWVAFETDDLSVDAQGRLVRRAGTGVTILTPPGRIVLPLNNHTFIFEADQ